MVQDWFIKRRLHVDHTRLVIFKSSFIHNSHMGMGECFGKYFSCYTDKIPPGIELVLG